MVMGHSRLLKIAPRNLDNTLQCSESNASACLHSRRLCFSLLPDSPLANCPCIRHWPHRSALSIILFVQITAVKVYIVAPPNERNEFKLSLLSSGSKSEIWTNAPKDLGRPLIFVVFYFFCFPDAVWASASGGFLIVSDTLVFMRVTYASTLFVVYSLNFNVPSF